MQELVDEEVSMRIVAGDTEALVWLGTFIGRTGATMIINFIDKGESQKMVIKYPFKADGHKFYNKIKDKPATLNAVRLKQFWRDPEKGVKLYRFDEN